MLLSLLAAGLLQTAPDTQPGPRTPQSFPGRHSVFVQGTLNLIYGERATLRQRADGEYELTQVERIRVQDVVPPAEGTTGPLNTAEPGSIRFGLHGADGVGILMKVENGQTQGLKYHGSIVNFVRGAPGEPQATSVCSVPAGMTVYEHWDDLIVQVVIGGLRRSDDTLPTCPPHVTP